MKGKRLTEEQIIAMLKESEAGGKTKDVCRRHGICEATLYNWKAKCAGMTVSARVHSSALPDFDNQKANPKREAEDRKRMEHVNCGFKRAEILDGNIGYLKFDFFADPGICGSTVVAAMNFLASVDAIILDLRENGGGDPKMAAFVSAERTHLNDLWTRKGDVTDQYWTDPYVPGKRLDGKLAFVLTSKDTFSGGEEFTNNLKVLKRAKIVGETTGGGAHPVRGHRITEHRAQVKDGANIMMSYVPLIIELTLLHPEEDFGEILRWCRPCGHQRHARPCAASSTILSERRATPQPSVVARPRGRTDKCVDGFHEPGSASASADSNG